MFLSLLVVLALIAGVCAVLAQTSFAAPAASPRNHPDAPLAAELVQQGTRPRLQQDRALGVGDDSG